ncbi:MAG: hypothetical protein U0414_00255 [Polyangiaceae bacterium]
MFLFPRDVPWAPSETLYRSEAMPHPRGLRVHADVGPTASRARLAASRDTKGYAATGDYRRADPSLQESLTIEWALPGGTPDFWIVSATLHLIGVFLLAMADRKDGVVMVLLGIPMIVAGIVFALIARSGTRPKHSVEVRDGRLRVRSPSPLDYDVGEIQHLHVARRIEPGRFETRFGMKMQKQWPRRWFDVVGRIAGRVVRLATFAKVEQALYCEAELRRTIALPQQSSRVRLEIMDTGGESEARAQHEAEVEELAVAEQAEDSKHVRSL